MSVKKVYRIELHNPGITIELKEPKHGEPSYGVARKNHKHTVDGNEVHHLVELLDGLKEIHTKVLDAYLLEIRLTFSNAEEITITYSGSFSVYQ